MLSLGCQGGIFGSGIEGGNGVNLTCNDGPYPIILHHGFSGGNGESAAGYFQGVADDLTWNKDRIVYEASVSPFNSSEVRGAELSNFVDKVLEETGACKVNIIAHSQGGLDSRYMISSLGYGDRVAALITVSTPHRGTALADLALGFASGWTESLANAIAGWVKGKSLDDPDMRAALESLAERYAGDFNAQNPDDERVYYFSVAGRSLLATAGTVCADGAWGNSSYIDVAEAMYATTGTYLFGSIRPWRWKANDGVVTVESAKWGTFLGCYPADHSDLTGSYNDGLDQSSGFDHYQMYRDFTDLLSAYGF